MILKNCRYIVTQDNHRILENVDIRIEEGIIEEIGEKLDGVDKIRCQDYIVLPGLVNAHTHTGMWFLRGFYDDAELSLWLKKVFEIEKSIPRWVVKLSSEAAILEMIMCGTTAFIDMYHYPEETAFVSEKTGVRAMLGPVFMDIFADPENIVKRTEEFIKTYGKSRYITPVINIHSIYNCSEETLLRAKDLQAKYNYPLHIHVSETRKEVYYSKTRYGVFPVEYLDKLGLITAKTILVHLGWITNWELDIVARSNAKCVHCPVSNMKLATAGFVPLREMLDKGITVGLGTGGPASNNSLDMFREMKVMVLLQRNNYWSVDIKAWQALNMATLHGYILLGLKGGKIKKGYVADLILLDKKSFRLNPLRRENIVSNIVYSATGDDVVATIVDGRIIYSREKKAEFIEKISENSEKLNEWLRKHMESV